MLILISWLFLCILGVCKRWCRTAFFVLEALACLILAVVQYATYFQDLLQGVLPYWILASLAALAIPTLKRDEESDWAYDAGPKARRKFHPFAGFPFRGGRNG